MASLHSLQFFKEMLSTMAEQDSNCACTSLSELLQNGSTELSQYSSASQQHSAERSRPVVKSQVFEAQGVGKPSSDEKTQLESTVGISVDIASFRLQALEIEPDEELKTHCSNSPHS